MATKNIVPRADGEGKLGTLTKRWAEAHFDILELGNGQIIFPATQVPNAGANILDDYEEGTWTPDLTFAGASVDLTYGERSGHYTKIGNFVHIRGSFTLTAKGSSVGAVNIKGLPFTPVIGDRGGSIGYMIDITYANFPMLLIENLAQIDLYEVTEGGAVSGVTNADFSNTSRIVFSASYFM